MHIESRCRKFISLRGVLLIALSAVALAGCGGGGGKEKSAQTAPASGQQPTPSPTPSPDPTPDPTPTPGPGLQNQAPTISGSAAASVSANSTYTFVPNAADADGDTLGFSITNKPSWATFTAATGRLSGTPGPADVGTYSNISISVSDGEASSTLSAFSIAVVAVANGTATLSWTAPTQNTDGSSLTNLSGYKISYGTSPAALTQTINIDNAGVTVYVVDNLAQATWYFSITAVNATGAESANSSLASKTI